ncbi:rod shape-determining protein MreC [Clostridium sp. JN-9]|uniref:rod shape-determining protein MreC n=1 Tax=Clostridium sp. JN-9 TaxID=2507159 RepID=UPI000FFE1ABD|nr:rod shape-determining protein MreC [Clostridium sp. JN-9]QAT39583.1 rod shape-determining protein MreC [Clostridium sp. JN-9]
MKFLKNKLAVTIIILSVTFLVLIVNSVNREKSSFVENGIGVTLNSVEGVFYNFNNKIKNTLGFVFNFSKVKQENEQLKERNSQLESMSQEYDSLKKQNDELRKQVNFQNQRSEYKYIGCDIIGKSGASYLDQFTINKGSKDGIVKQMVAITSQGLVGQVISVSNNWAVVQTFASDNLAVHAMVESTNETNGIAKGYKDSSTNSLLAKIFNLPLNSQIKKGDVILTSGLGQLYPKGIRIGYVTDVQDDQSKAMKVAVIQPYVDVNKLQEVFMVVPKSAPKNNLDDIKY